MLMNVRVRFLKSILYLEYIKRIFLLNEKNTLMMYDSYY